MTKRILLSILNIILVSAIVTAQEQYVETIQLFGYDEGAAMVKPGQWHVVTKVLYPNLSDLFTKPVPSGYTREYYLGIRKADNVDNCSSGEGIQFRFYFKWANKGGHYFTIDRDWGITTEGTMRWIKVPDTYEQAIRAGADPKYWRIEARIASSCSDKRGIIYGIYVKAIDKVGGTQPPISLNNDPVAGTLATFRFSGIGEGINNKNGKIGIGTEDPDALLTVKGNIHTQEVKVDLSVPGPDYVFEKDYNLPSLTAVEDYITQNKHLPEVPSAKEMEANGINLSEMNMLLLKKVEELTLYLIDQKKEIIELQQALKTFQEKTN